MLFRGEQWRTDFSTGDVARVVAVAGLDSLPNLSKISVDKEWRVRPVENWPGFDRLQDKVCIDWKGSKLTTIGEIRRRMLLNPATLSRQAAEPPFPPSPASQAQSQSQVSASGTVKALPSAPAALAEPQGSPLVAAAVDEDSALACALHEVDLLRAENESMRYEASAFKLQLEDSRAEARALRNQLDAPSRRVAQVVVPVEINAADLDFCAAKVEIGRGAAAVVFAATLRGESVAVKEMHGKAADIRDAAAQELAIAKRLIGHANIVTTFGVVQEADRLSLVMERLPLTLSDALYGGRDKAALQLSASQRLAIAHGVASGLRYCHTQVPPVLHRDLKPGNVLLSEDLRTIKLCDFGSARALANASAMTLGVGTTQYMAPEVLNPPEDGNVKYDAKVDVYSFGVLLWELFSAAKPFAQMQPAQIAVAVLVKKTRPSPDPPTMPAAIVALMKRCWAAEPGERPTVASAIGPLAQALMQADAAAKEAAEARHECVICADAVRSIALSPCGHVCLCEDCAGELRECPMCRRAIEARLKVFHA